MKKISLLSFTLMVTAYANANAQIPPIDEIITRDCTKDNTYFTVNEQKLNEYEQLKKDKKIKSYLLDFDEQMDCRKSKCPIIPFIVGQHDFIEVKFEENIYTVYATDDKKDKQCITYNNMTNDDPCYYWEKNENGEIKSQYTMYAKNYFKRTDEPQVQGLRDLKNNITLIEVSEAHVSIGTTKLFGFCEKTLESNYPLYKKYRYFNYFSNK